MTNKYRLLVIVGLALVIVIAIVALLFGRKSEDRLRGELEIWSLEEPAVWRDLIAAFESSHRKVNVTYVQKSAANYEPELLNAIAGGRGPDLFAVHPSWTRKHADKLAPLEETLMSISQFRSTFVDVTAKDLIRGERIWALPFWVDTLALYYNKGLFNAAAIVEPPRTWEEFLTDVRKLVRRDDSGDILLAGAAMGTASNVEHAADIVQALMLQSGAKMVNEATGRAEFDRTVTLKGESFNPGESALSFYAGFASPASQSYTWNRRLPAALQSFTQGKAAMYLGYARDLVAIKSSGVSFGVAPFPQIVDRKDDPAYIDLTYADYWALGLARSSRNPAPALGFMRLVSSRNALFSFLAKAQLPAARRDLIEVQTRDENLAVFARQNLTAASWPRPDFASTRGVFNSMIEDVTLGRASVKEAVKSGANQITELLKK